MSISVVGQQKVRELHNLNFKFYFFYKKTHKALSYDHAAHYSWNFKVLAYGLWFMSMVVVWMTLNLLDWKFCIENIFFSFFWFFETFSQIEILRKIKISS